jgi:hypothetical protein
MEKLLFCGDVGHVQPENEFLDVIGTKVLRVFLLAIFTVTFSSGFYPPPPPAGKSDLKLLYNVNIVHSNLQIRGSSGPVSAW